MSQLDPEARKVLSLARAARTPSAADRQRIRLQLAASVAGGVAGAAGAEVAHAAGAAPAVTHADALVGSLEPQLAQSAPGVGTLQQAVGLVSSLKVYVAGAALVLSTAAGFVLLNEALRDHPTPMAAANAQVPAPSGDSRSAAANADAPAHHLPGPGIDVRSRSARPAAVDAPALASSAVAPSDRPAAQHGAATPFGDANASPRPPARLDRGQTERGPRATVLSPPPRAAAAAVPSGSLARELDLLHGAQRAWRERDSEKTLSLLDQHARKYPSSALRDERAALRVLALCEVGRQREAHRLGKTLIRRAASSPVRATIEDSCAFK